MSKDDDAYNEGYESGRDGGFLTDLAHSLPNLLPKSRRNDISDRGFKQGQKDRALYGRRGRSASSDHGTSGSSVDSASSSDFGFLGIVALLAIVLYMGWSNSQRQAGKEEQQRIRSAPEVLRADQAFRALNFPGAEAEFQAALARYENSGKP